MCVLVLADSRVDWCLLLWHVTCIIFRSQVTWPDIGKARTQSDWVVYLLSVRSARFQAVEELLESLELEKSNYHMGLSRVSDASCIHFSSQCSSTYELMQFSCYCKLNISFTVLILFVVILRLPSFFIAILKSSSFFFVVFTFVVEN